MEKRNVKGKRFSPFFCRISHTGKCGLKERTEWRRVKLVIWKYLLQAAGSHSQGNSSERASNLFYHIMRHAFHMTAVKAPIQPTVVKAHRWGGDYPAFCGVGYRFAGRWETSGWVFNSWRVKFTYSKPLSDHNLNWTPVAVCKEKDVEVPNRHSLLTSKDKSWSPYLEEWQQKYKTVILEGY